MSNNTFRSRFRRAWNIFLGRDPTRRYENYGLGSFSRSGWTPFSLRGEGTIASAVYNRISLDAASTEIKHVKLDDNGRYKSTIDSSLNTVMSLEANKDQTGRSFFHDLVRSMLDEGCVAAVPTFPGAIAGRRPDGCPALWPRLQPVPGGRR